MTQEPENNPIHSHNTDVDANRNDWLRAGGFFHDLMMGRVAASGATGDEFDQAIDRAMAEERDDGPHPLEVRSGHAPTKAHRARLAPRPDA